MNIFTRQYLDFTVYEGTFHFTSINNKNDQFSFSVANKHFNVNCRGTTSLLFSYRIYLTCPSYFKSQVSSFCIHIKAFSQSCIIYRQNKRNTSTDSWKVTDFPDGHLQGWTLSDSISQVHCACTPQWCVFLGAQRKTYLTAPLLRVLTHWLEVFGNDVCHMPRPSL